MYSGNPTASRVLLLAAVMGAVAVGCARPRGVMFPPLEPPRVWPAPPDPSRIKLLGTIGGSHDLHAARPALEAIKAVFRGPRPPITFSSPHALAVRAPGVLAVADGMGGAVHIIDLSERTHRVVTGFGTERFGVPLGVAWVGDRLFVTDVKRHEVIEMDSLGRWTHRFGGDVLTRPVGIAYAPAPDQLFVVDRGAHRLVVFDVEGAVVQTIGLRGSGPGEFNFPTHIHYARDRLLVSDSGNFRVQILDRDGRWLQTIGKKGNGAGDFSLPKGVAMDAQGRILVTDAHFENVQIFDSAGRLLMAFGQEGGAAGEFVLPAGLAIDDQGRIWVADSGNRRLQVFTYVGASS